MMKDFKEFMNIIKNRPGEIYEFVVPFIAYRCGLITGTIATIGKEAGLTNMEIESAIMSEWDDEGILELNDQIDFAWRLKENEKAYQIIVYDWPEEWAKGNEIIARVKSMTKQIAGMITMLGGIKIARPQVNSEGNCILCGGAGIISNKFGSMDCPECQGGK